MVKDELIQIVHLGELFQLRKEPGVARLPVLSVTMNDGLVHRDTLDRKTGGKLAPDEHLLIRKGDLAYNMMRMWQGASGLAKQDGIVSPAYVVVTPSDAIDPTFAFYWFKSTRMIHLFWAHSYGITGDRLRLYYKDFAKIPVTVPSKNDQIQIGKTLAAADRAIARTEDLIAAKRRLKEGLAQQLLTGKRRLPGLTERWRDAPLRNLCVIAYGKSQKAIDSESGCFPIFGTGGVVGLTNRALHPGPAIILGRKGSIDRPSLASGPFWAIDTTFYAVPAEDVSVEWLYQKFCTIRWRRFNEATGVPSLSRDNLYRIRLKTPSRDEQERIATVIGAVDRSLEILEQKLASLRYLKHGLMQKLLPSEPRVEAV